MKCSVVVNYFNPGRRPELQRTVLFCLEGLLQTAGKDAEIICADGSGGTPCDALNAFARGRGVVYAPSDAPEEFAVTYNRGCALAKGEILVLCASDIFTYEPWLEELTRQLDASGAAMACPYLSYTDYIAQAYSAPPKRNRFAPCCLTINVNAIRRETWATVGPLSTSYTGNYNDLDYLIRLRQRGLQAIIADCGLITHLGGITLSAGSLLRREQDQATFNAQYPAFATEDFWHRCWHPLLCKSSVFRMLLRSVRQVPPRRRRMLRITSMLRFEPLFNRV